MSVNKVILLGYVGADPEVRYIGDSGNQTKVATLRIATSKKYRTSSGEDREDTQWHNVIAYRGFADVVEKYVRKGSMIFVEGELRHRRYTDRQGVEKFATDVLVSSLQLLGRRSDSAIQGAKMLTRQNQMQTQHSVGFSTGASTDGYGPTDDIPF